MMRTIRARAIPFLAAAGALVLTQLVAAGTADAQQEVRTELSERADTVEVMILPPIQVRVILGADIQHTPGAASILSAGRIQNLRPHTLHDALDFVPGIRTIDDDVLGRRTGIGIRGAPPRRSRKTLLLEDGSPINSSAYLDPGSHYTPPVERLERVEVLKGAGQLLHGPLNNHGVINFLNRGPTATPETTLEVGAGELNTFKRHALHSRTEGPIGMVFAYTGMNADGGFDIESHQFDDFFARFDFDAHMRHRLVTSLTYFRERSDGYDEANLTPEQFAAHPRSKAVLEEGREYNNIAVDFFRADLAHETRLFGLDVSTRVFASRLDRPRFQTRGTSPADGGVMEGRDRRYRVLGMETRFDLARGQLFGGEHTLQGGIRIERHRFEDRRPVGRPGEELDTSNPGNALAVAGEDGYTRDGRVVSYDGDAQSVFMLGAMDIGDWIVTPGLRVETYVQARDAVFWPGSDVEGVRERERNTLLLPGISFLYHGFLTTQVYAGLHRGFAPASARTDEFPLVPETGVNAQIGIRSTALRGTAFDVAVFYNRIANTLIRDNVDSFGDALFINAADSRIYGIDVSARVNANTYTGSLLNPFAEVAYNFTRSEFSGGPLHGLRVPEIPDHVGSLSLGVEQGDAWQISTTASYFGGFYADKENTRELGSDGGRVPARTLMSARVNFSPAAVPGTIFWIQGRNLTDRLYVSDVQDGLRAGAARSVMGGVTFRF